MFQCCVPAVSLVTNNIFDFKLMKMSVEEMKMEAVKKINQLQNEQAVKEILNHLETLNKDSGLKKSSADDLFEEAQKKYDNLLKRLA